MARHNASKRRPTGSSDDDRQVTFSGERKLMWFGDSIGVTLPKNALSWTLHDTDIVGSNCTVVLYSDGTYEIELPTQ